MNPFVVYLFLGTLAVLLQGYLAFHGGYFSAHQIYEVHNRTDAYSFLQHGAMWTNLLALNPAAAYVVSTYRLPYKEPRGLIALALVIVATVFLLVQWEHAAAFTPEAHTETAAGAVHAVYMGVVMWIFLLYYIGRTRPDAGKDMIAIAAVITLNSFFGVIKFSPRWEWTTPAVAQFLLPSLFVWVMTAVRLWR